MEQRWGSIFYIAVKTSNYNTIFRINNLMYRKAITLKTLAFIRSVNPRAAISID